MSLPGREILRLAVLLGASHLLSVSLLAQAATNLPALTRSNSTPPRLLRDQTAGAASDRRRRCRWPDLRSASSANCWR